MNPERLQTVCGTRRSKAAAWREERRNAETVYADGNHEKPRRDGGRIQIFVIIPALVRAFASSALTTCILTRRISLRGMTTIPHGAISG